MGFESPEAKAERELQDILAQQKQEENPEPDPAEKAEEPPKEEPAKKEEAEPAAKPPAADDDPNSQTWKDRYYGLQGVYRAEREDRAQERGRLEARIAELETRPAQEEEIELDDTYRSPQVTDAVRQSVPYKRMLAAYGQKHAELHFESIAPAPETKKEEKANPFFVHLKVLASNWEALNSDPAFLTWLAAPVPYTGRTRHQMLNEAVQKGDAPAAAQFFIDYSGIQPQTTTTTKTPEDLTAPPARGSAAQTSVETHQGKVYSRAEWDDGWKKLELNKLPQKEAQELERELTNAMNEGRVVG